MVFKLVEGAQKSWRRIDGHNQLPKLILGVKFADGIEPTILFVGSCASVTLLRTIRPDQARDARSRPSSMSEAEVTAEHET
jgi:hypothetical protein